MNFGYIVAYARNLAELSFFCPKTKNILFRSIIFPNKKMNGGFSYV